MTSAFCSDPDNLAATLYKVLEDMLSAVAARISKPEVILATRALRRMGITNEDYLRWYASENARQECAALTIRLIESPPKTIEAREEAATGDHLDQVQDDLMPWPEPYPEALGVDVQQAGIVTEVRPATADKPWSDLDFFVAFAGRFGREKSTTIAHRFAKAVPPHDGPRAFGLMDEAVAAGRLAYVDSDGNRWELGYRQYVQVVKV